MVWQKTFCFPDDLIASCVTKNRTDKKQQQASDFFDTMEIAPPHDCKIAISVQRHSVTNIKIVYFLIVCALMISNFCLFFSVVLMCARMTIFSQKWQWCLHFDCSADQNQYNWAKNVTLTSGDITYVSFSLGWARVGQQVPQYITNPHKCMTKQTEHLCLQCSYEHQ